MAKRKSTNNDPTKHTYKTKDRATRTPLKTGVKSGALNGKAVPAPLVEPVMLLQLQSQ